MITWKGCITLYSSTKSNWCLILFDIQYHGKRWCNLSTYQRFWPETLWWQEGKATSKEEDVFFSVGIYGISMNQTELRQKLHRFSRHFGYQITSLLINLPGGCHQKTLIHYLHPTVCSAVAKMPLWNCLFLISNDQIALLSGRPGDIMFNRLSK